MLKITSFKVESNLGHVVTDERHPVFSYAVEDWENQHVKTVLAEIQINGERLPALNQTAIRYEGKELEPFHVYEATLIVTDNKGEVATSKLSFETGFLGKPFIGKWITDSTYSFTEKKVSPLPMTFMKKLALKGKVKSAKAYCTAIGIYDLLLDGKKVGDRYFAPGFTSYQHDLQYQCYDLTSTLKADSTVNVIVAGGWAVGSFVFTRVNRVTHDKQALLFELHVTYEDGSEEVIASDETWSVSMAGPVRMADFYDGETYDANIDLDSISYHGVSLEKLGFETRISAEIGSPVIPHEEMKPVKEMTSPSGKRIYDFGQNFAGVVSLHIKNAKGGEKIVVHHAEILTKEGELNLAFLRSAKATLEYIAKPGEQTFTPTFTYMGFRYISLEGMDPNEVEVTAYALYSDIEEVGHFECSEPLLNRLQQNILWSSKSNFVDIPTDCPQRDERMGWTGDINVFAPTACFNFDMDRFLKKWLRDVKSEQHRGGGIPNTVPVQGYGFPATMPVMAIDFWGDATLTVPFALYDAYGDKAILEKMYPTMKKYVDACSFWARFMSLGTNRYIWKTPSVFHFGDWVAPDLPKMQQWQARAPWTATASLAHTSRLLSKAATILGNDKDEKKYSDLSDHVDHAYEKKFMDEDSRLKNEFQTGYVLPIQFDMLPKEKKKKAAHHLAELVRKNDYVIGTGFPGTPYILFALADNGEEETAMKMLLNTKCPSWLYEVKVGGTTIWERWDGLNDEGVCTIGDDGTGGMISFNHYASGSVGAFLYQRIAGIEALSPGYRSFRVKPLLTKEITSCRAGTMTPFGKIDVSWEVKDNRFEILVSVPVNSTCALVMPSGEEKTLDQGRYHFEENIG